MKDFLGREITRGKHIVYPGRRSSSLWMNLGLVTEVMERAQAGGTVTTLKVQPLSPTAPRRSLGKPVTVTCTDKVTVVELPDPTA